MANLEGMVGPQTKEGRSAPRLELGTHTSRTAWHLHALRSRMVPKSNIQSHIDQMQFLCLYNSPWPWRLGS